MATLLDNPLARAAAQAGIDVADVAQEAIRKALEEKTGRCYDCGAPKDLQMDLDRIREELAEVSNYIRTSIQKSTADQGPLNQSWNALKRAVDILERCA